MTTATKAILKQALGLDPVERVELIGKLFHSFDKAPDDKIDILWSDEAESRIDAYDAGQITADSAKAVFGRINKRRTSVFFPVPSKNLPMACIINRRLRIS